MPLFVKRGGFGDEDRQEGTHVVAYTSAIISSMNVGRNATSTNIITIAGAT